MVIMVMIIVIGDDVVIMKIMVMIITYDFDGNIVNDNDDLNDDISVIVFIMIQFIIMLSMEIK